MAFEDLYRQRFPADERERKNAIWRVLCRDFFSHYVRPGDVVLDLGAGHCELINNLAAGQRFAVDMSEDVKEMSEPGVTALVGDARHLQGLGLPPVDVVFASNIFEHVPSKDHLQEILTAVFAVLRPGGRLVVMQPNLRYVGGEYWDFLDHHLPLTHVTMEEILGVTGFELEEVRPRFLPYSTKSRLPQHPLLVRLYLKVPLAHRLLGKQMLVVARKPG